MGKSKCEKFFPDSNLVLIAIEKKFTDCFSLRIPSLLLRKLSSALLKNVTSFCWWFVKILLSNQVRREMGHRRRSFLVADVVLILSIFFPFRNHFHPARAVPNIISLRTTFSASSNESLNFHNKAQFGIRLLDFLDENSPRRILYRRWTK